MKYEFLETVLFRSRTFELLTEWSLLWILPSFMSSRLYMFCCNRYESWLRVWVSCHLFFSWSLAFYFAEMFWLRLLEQERWVIIYYFVALFMLEWQCILNWSLFVWDFDTWKFIAIMWTKYSIKFLWYS